MLVGIAVSAVLHVLVIVVYSTLVRGPERTVVVFPVPPVVAEAEGLQVLRLVEVTTPEAANPRDPAPIQEVDRPDVDVVVPDIGDEPPAYLPRRYRSAAERLMLSEGDPRLWQPIDPELLAPLPEELLRIRIATLIAGGNDSALAEARLLARAMDWTYTDDDGKRWGLSPGMIHLGDIAVPLPFGFGPPPDYNGDRAEWAFRMNDIQRAAGTLAARQSWRERVEVMRKRREARRAEENASRANGPPVVKPDTTSSRPRRR